MTEKRALSLRLPATSANLGPGFDTLALALALYLEIEAGAAPDFHIEASGRSPEICGAREGNLLLETYKALWSTHAAGPVQPLALEVRNGIPLGMGCGSSAASRLAGIALCSHFAGLGWTTTHMLELATELEHHPDNAAACCLGGLVASGYGLAREGLRPVNAVSIQPQAGWYGLLALPELPLATTVSRSVLPDAYERSAVVENLQNVALLVAAFAGGDGALLRAATRDRMHQPYRATACPLLPRLLPLAAHEEILSVTLSGAGSGVLLLLRSAAAVKAVESHIRLAAGDIALAELLPCALAPEGAVLS